MAGMGPALEKMARGRGIEPRHQGFGDPTETISRPSDVCPDSQDDAGRAVGRLPARGFPAVALGLRKSWLRRPLAGGGAEDVGAEVIARGGSGLLEIQNFCGRHLPARDPVADDLHGDAKGFSDYRNAASRINDFLEIAHGAIL